MCESANGQQDKFPFEGVSDEVNREYLKLIRENGEAVSIELRGTLLGDIIVKAENVTDFMKVWPLAIEEASKAADKGFAAMAAVKNGNVGS